MHRRTRNLPKPLGRACLHPPRMRLRASASAVSQEDGVASGLHEGDEPPLQHVNWEVFLTLPSARLFWLRYGDVLLMRAPRHSSRSSNRRLASTSHPQQERRTCVLSPHALSRDDSPTDPLA